MLDRVLLQKQTRTKQMGTPGMGTRARLKTTNTKNGRPQLPPALDCSPATAFVSEDAAAGRSSAPRQQHSTAQHSAVQHSTVLYSAGLAVSSTGLADCSSRNERTRRWAPKTATQCEDPYDPPH